MYFPWHKFCRYTTFNYLYPSLWIISLSFKVVCYLLKFFNIWWKFDIFIWWFYNLIPFLIQERFKLLIHNIQGSDVKQLCLENNSCILTISFIKLQAECHQKDPCHGYLQNIAMVVITVLHTIWFLIHKYEPKKNHTHTHKLNRL